MEFLDPRIFPKMWLQFMVNVRKYSIHGAYGHAIWGGSSILGSCFLVLILLDGTHQRKKQKATWVIQPQIFAAALVFNDVLSVGSEMRSSEGQIIALYEYIYVGILYIISGAWTYELLWNKKQCKQLTLEGLTMNVPWITSLEQVKTTRIILSPQKISNTLPIVMMFHVANHLSRSSSTKLKRYNIYWSMSFRAAFASFKFWVMMYTWSIWDGIFDYGAEV